MAERPIALTPYLNARPFACASCFSDSREFKKAKHGLPHRWTIKCNGCGVLRYCSTSCEEKHTRRHRSSCECAALKSIALFEREAMDHFVGVDSYELMNQAIRILADRHAGLSVEVYPGRRLCYDDISTRLVGIERSEAAAATILQAAEGALRVVPEAARVPVDELCGLLNRQQANVYGVSGRAACQLGRASFGGALHLFNHSCCPNLAFDSIPIFGEDENDETPSFGLIALRNIEEGEPLCMSYTCPDDEVIERKQHLKLYYGFDCVCVRCGVGGESIPSPGVRCPHDDCGTGYAIGGRCVHCGKPCEVEDQQPPSLPPSPPPADLNRHAIDALIENAFTTAGWNNSARQRVLSSERKEDHAQEMTYGEIGCSEALRVLELTGVRPRAGEVFCDLGCGRGQIVLGAWCKWKHTLSSCFGIDALNGLIQVAESVSSSVRSNRVLDEVDDDDAELRFRCADFFAEDSEWLSADILWITSTTYPSEWFEYPGGALSKRLLKLKIGSRICITTRNIGHIPGLKCIHSVRDLMTSWGNLDTCFVFERVADVAPASLGPKAEFERVWGPPP